MFLSDCSLLFPGLFLSGLLGAWKKKSRQLCFLTVFSKPRSRSSHKLLMWETRGASPIRLSPLHSH